VEKEVPDGGQLLEGKEGWGTDYLIIFYRGKKLNLTKKRGGAPWNDLGRSKKGSQFAGRGALFISLYHIKYPHLVEERRNIAFTRGEGETKARPGRWLPPYRDLGIATFGEGG